MKPPTFMLIAGDPSGDLLAAELVEALRQRTIAGSQDFSSDVQPLRTALAPGFLGAGGPRMAAAGVELAFDLTRHAVIGLSDVIKKIFEFRRMFRQLQEMAIERQPDVIIGVDYGGFNLRFGSAIKNYVRRHRTEFTPWNPKIVQFVSPQVWASRPGRAYTLEENYDLLLSIFPFEKKWYARRVPNLRVEFVGHPMVGRSQRSRVQSSKLGGALAQNPAPQPSPHLGGAREKETGACVVLLPGSRADEVRRHWPVVTAAYERMRAELATLSGTVVLPNETLASTATRLGLSAGLGIQVGDAVTALSHADLAITKSGTITMECAMAGVPAVVFYKTSWPTYLIGKQIVSVKYLSMPNLLAGGEVYPEFVQHEATPESIARAGLELLRDESRRAAVKSKLAEVIASLGGPGAPGHAAEAILSLLP